MPGWLHERLAEALARTAILAGAEVFREHPVRIGQRTLFADLVVRYGGRVGLVEVERSSDRVAADVEKATALGARFLLVATPDRQTAAAVERAVARIREGAGCPAPIVVAPYAQAIKALNQLLTLDDVLVGRPVQ